MPTFVVPYNFEMWGQSELCLNIQYLPRTENTVFPDYKNQSVETV